MYALNEDGTVASIEATPRLREETLELDRGTGAIRAVIPKLVVVPQNYARPCYVCGAMSQEQIQYPDYALTAHQYCWMTWAGGKAITVES
jgi:hypothetical protein